MEDEIRVDAEALQREVIKNAETSGFTIKAYCPFVDWETFHNTKAGSSPVMPLVNVEGYTNQMTIAFMIKALQTTIGKLKKKPGVEEALAFIDLITTQKDIEVESKEKRLENE